MLPDLGAFGPRALVPMYRVDGSTFETEVGGAIALIDEVTERLRRLAQAYGEWRDFDAGAYFDLTPAQVAGLIYLRERVSTVHVRFASDLLLPSFQRALRFWREEYAPAYTTLAATVSGGWPEESMDERLPQDLTYQMRAHWQEAVSVAATVRRRLADDIGYMSMRGAGDERMRWQRYWQMDGKDVAAPLTLSWDEIPALTLVFDFPLPPSRQPGRLRRLRRNRNRRRTV